MVKQRAQVIDEKMRQAVTAMSEATRLRILLLLGQRGPLSTFAPAAKVPAAKAAAPTDLFTGTERIKARRKASHRH